MPLVQKGSLPAQEWKDTEVEPADPSSRGKHLLKWRRWCEYYTSDNLKLLANVKKVKAFPYSTPSVGPGADPGLQAVSPQVTVSHPPGGRLPLLTARPAVTFSASEHHRPSAGTKLYCLVIEAHGCKQLAQGCYAASP